MSKDCDDILALTGASEVSKSTWSTSKYLDLEVPQSTWKYLFSPTCARQHVLLFHWGQHHSDTTQDVYFNINAIESKSNLQMKINAHAHVPFNTSLFAVTRIDTICPSSCLKIGKTERFLTNMKGLLPMWAEIKQMCLKMWKLRKWSRSKSTKCKEN